MLRFPPLPRVLGASAPSRLLAMALLLAALAGCAPRAEIRSATPLAEIQPPQFALLAGQTGIERFDPPGAGAGLDLAIAAQVRNPNDFPVRLTAVDYTVFLAGSAVARGRLEPDLALAARGERPLRFHVETDLSGRRELLRAVVRAFADTPLPFRVEGRLSFASSSYAFTTNPRPLLEGAATARQSVEPPRLRLEEAESEVYLLRPDLPVVRVVIRASNPGDIGYFLYGKDLSLSLGGAAVAREDMAPVPVPAGDDSRVDILFYPSAAGLDERGRDALEAALQGIPTSVAVEGALFMDVLGVDTFEVPSGWRVSGFVDADR